VTLHYGSAIILGALMSVGSSGQVADEYKVKAAFLYNFPKFVEWPPHSFKGPADPIVIGVLGRNPFHDALSEALAGKTINGRPFQVREISDASQATGCQMLFVAASERKRITELLKGNAITGVLTIGETANFAEEGGVVNFKIEEGTVRLQINLEAARRQQLHISAKLLSLAEIVGK
jgi:YfiR/HmsC-like